MVLDVLIETLSSQQVMTCCSCHMLVSSHLVVLYKRSHHLLGILAKTYADDLLALVAAETGYVNCILSPENAFYLMYLPTQNITTALILEVL
jgi:hypothetical protein